MVECGGALQPGERLPARLTEFMTVVADTSESPAIAIRRAVRANGTSTLAGWCAARNGFAADDAREEARRLMEGAFSSDAAVVMCTLQDALGLTDEARMNVPGVAGGNWRWHAAGSGMDAAAAWLHDLAEKNDRLA